MFSLPLFDLRIIGGRVVQQWLPRRKATAMQEWKYLKFALNSQR
jgi:hypothetical protein